VRDLLLRAEEQQGQIAELNERLRRAMTETHHRVKNNLQVIAALVDLRCMDDIETLPLDEFRRIGTHVRTLAAVHDILTTDAKEDGRASHVSAKQILEKLLGNVQSTTPLHDVTYALTDMRLSVRQATALALVANEVVSNAIKHGRSTAQVALTSDADEAVFQVTDDGPGFPPGFDATRSANTGLELVENISRWDLRGETRYETAPDTGGGRVSVTFPLAPM
jgi:two-component sensor histidine kinase